MSETRARNTANVATELVGIALDLANLDSEKLDVAGGKILQVVFASYSTETTTTGTSAVDTGLTATITPTSASNSILVLAAHNSNERSAGTSNNNGLNIRLRRGATTLVIASTLGWTGTNFRMRPGAASFVYLDSPNTTSATTYKTQFSSNAAGDSVTVQIGNNASTICLLEVSA